MKNNEINPTNATRTITGRVNDLFSGDIMIKALSRVEPSKRLDDPSFEYVPAVHTTTETIYGKAMRETLKLYNANGEVVEECLIYYPRVVV